MLRPTVSFRKEHFGGIAFDGRPGRSDYLSLNETAFQLLRAFDEADEFTDCPLSNPVNLSPELRVSISNLVSVGLLANRHEGNDQRFKMFRGQTHAPSGWLAAPTVVDIYPHFFCNQMCKFCYVGFQVENPPKETLGLSKIPHLVENLNSAGVFQVGILGGEPFLYPHLRELVEALTDSRISVSIATNGTVLDKDLLCLCRDRMVNLDISIQADEADLHDRIVQKPGTHTRATRTLTTAIELGVPLLLSAVLNPMNVHRAVPFVEWGARLGVRFFGFFDPEPTVFALQHGMRLNFKEFFTAIKAAKKRGRELGVGVNSNCHYDFLLDENTSSFQPNHPLAKYLYGDKAGRSKVDVLPNGDIYPNYELFFRDQWKLGNIFEDELFLLWRSSQVVKTIKGSKLPHSCQKCIHSPICGGGLLGRRLAQGSPTFPPNDCPILNGEWP